MERGPDIHPAAVPRLGRLLAINQAAGPLMRELLEDLSRQGVACSLLTGRLDAPHEWEPPFEIISAAALAKAPGWKRLWTWGVFSAQAVWRCIRSRRARVLVATNPPWVMLAMPLLKRLFHIRYVLLMYDIYPDILERMGLLAGGGRIARFWRYLSGRSLAAASGVITLGAHMAETIRGHLRPGDAVDVEVIPNWADTNSIRPLPKSDNPFARRHGLTDKFVVVYSGAFGATHDTESIVAAAEMLTDLPDVHVLLIGGGTRLREVADLVRETSLPNLTLLPFQPFETLPYSLSVADCAIVSLDEGYEGISVPSKTYYALAAGAALLAISAPGAELSDMVAEHGCGVHLPPRDPQALAEAVRRLRGDPGLLNQYKSAARRAAEEKYSRRIATRRYLDYLSRRLG